MGASTAEGGREGTKEESFFLFFCESRVGFFPRIPRHLTFKSADERLELSHFP